MIQYAFASIAISTFGGSDQHDGDREAWLDPACPMSMYSVQVGDLSETPFNHRAYAMLRRVPRGDN